jgi:hypothetical protein
MAMVEDGLQSAILAPQGAAIPRSALNVNRDRNMHARLLGEMQRLRGRIAQHEDAITESMLDSSGRHVMPGDEKSWHVLRLRSDGKIAGCARILVHPRNVLFPRLRIATSSVARCSVWGKYVQDAVESELTRARRGGLTTIEPGGWVVDEDLRGTCEAISIALSAFAWAQILGDCVGFVTATVKHGSSAILRRLGGRSLQARGQTIPKYFESAWGCDAELLRFDTNSLNPRYEAALASVRYQLRSAPVFCADAPCRQTAQVFGRQNENAYQPAFA